jgi:hypothetical protein
MIRLEYELPGNLTFKLAETKQELEQAFKLLHDSYVAEGFMKPELSGLRLTSYHALPTTSTLVAKWNDEVVGTVSLIRQSSMGLPLQQIFDISEIEDKGDQIVEISSLAIRRDFRGNFGHILLPLCKFLYEYCIRYLRVDQMVIAVNPRQLALYESIMLFRTIKAKPVPSYSFVNNAPAVGAVMDLRQAYNRLMSVYFNVPASRNMFAYFMQAKSPAQFQFPDRNYFKVSDPVMTPDLMNYFFNNRTQVFANLPEGQKTILRSIYAHSPGYLDLLPEATGNRWPVRRRHYHRFQTQCPGNLAILPIGLASPMKVVEVSEKGFLANIEIEAHIGQRARVRIQVSDFESIEADAIVVWKGENSRYGFTLLSDSTNWSRFIRHLDCDFQKDGRRSNPQFPGWENEQIAESTKSKASRSLKKIIEIAKIRVS